MRPYQTTWKKEEAKRADTPWYGKREILVALITGAISSTVSIINLILTL